jgi:hypothetical protein
MGKMKAESVGDLVNIATRLRLPRLKKFIARMVFRATK